MRRLHSADDSIPPSDFRACLVAAVLRQQLANGSGIVTRRRISPGNLADRIAEIRERMPGIGRIESMLQLVPQNEDKLSRCRQLSAWRCGQPCQWQAHGMVLSIIFTTSVRVRQRYDLL
ncbi:hypothetical protein A6R73_04615 [Xanthomonas translucens pv. poae]|uniref:Uncharacterized protein n=1 Tax=Xanthomonas graminis pv. poae TaxID=227946 RepID=A0A199NYP7_9XANT|nr:hypothetical protein A6R73_04615 [Xanthomonas translucens pv. poae]